MSIIAILLPGTTGTALTNDSVIVWPDAVLLQAKSNPQGALNILENESLEPGNPLGWVCGNGYGAFAGYFALLGFQTVTATAANLSNLPSSLSGNLLIGFGYDWRQDNTKSAGNLRTLLQTISQSYGNGNQIFLIGHSMGGLVARTYLENPSSANDPWYGSIAGLITLGTPHLGAPLALEGIMGTLPVPPQDASIETIIPEFINNPAFDSSYELLPPNQTTLALQTAFLTDGSNTYSIFDPNLPQEITEAITGLSQSSLSEASAFFNQLNYAGSSTLPPYFCVAGNTFLQGTCNSFTYASNALTSQTTNKLGVPVLGDGVVPTWSALFQGRPVPVTSYSVPSTCNVTHGQLPGNANIQKQVAQWMKVPR
jgi:pimeloyl-ACP methyl ester carboxylesterase